MSRIIDAFITSIRASANYNPNVQVAPHCILWTDAERQWEIVIPRLQEEMPELFVLGEYDPSLLRGPAIWLRCVLARTLPNISLLSEAFPVFYLPGVSRQSLRAVENCPDHLKPLAELQYRGVIWSQANAKDWTILAFLQSSAGGLNLDVAQSKETKSALQLALPNLMEASPSNFRNKRLDQEDFLTLISNDPTGDLLKWVDNSASFRKKKTQNEWMAFNALCRHQFAFDPEREGPLSAAEKLANHATGTWSAIWQRYIEAADSTYQNIAQQIKRVDPPSNDIFWRNSATDQFHGWPQWNEYHEGELRNRLTALANSTIKEAQAAIHELEQQHGSRRSTIWAKKGWAPLAEALHHLATLATVTAQTPLNSGTTEEMANGYAVSGWRADDAVMRALACVKDNADQEAVKAVIQVIYLPWAEGSARYLQQLVWNSTYPKEADAKQTTQNRDGTCILFVDGLRFDVAQRLIEKLKRLEFEVRQQTRWAALPSVTATGKPAVSPVRHLITGSDTNANFDPELAESHKPLTSATLTKALNEDGWLVLKSPDTGSGSGKAWTEIGWIDQFGHKDILPEKLDDVVNDIYNHVQSLLKAGWRTVEIVTDHGWLFMPGGLPKSELPSVLAENKWGRCAALKTGSHYDGRVYPWFWNTNQHFALADGISCFRNGISYAHGGLSLQECLVTALIVTSGAISQSAGMISITEINWNELRCKIAVSGGTSAQTVDLRTQPNDANSSVAYQARRLKENGITSLAVEDEELIGQSAYAVVLDDQNKVLAQKITTIGGNTNA